MGKRKMIVLIATVLVCLVVGAGFWRYHGLVDGFPRWEAAEELDMAEHRLGVAEFLGLETVTKGDLAWDELTVQLAAEEEYMSITFSDYTPYYLDYKFLGRWYNVWEGNNMNAFVMNEPTEVQLRLPPGAFSQRGQYRVRFGGSTTEAGRCQFRVSKPTMPVAGKQYNDFPGWQSKSYRDANISPDFERDGISLSAKGITIEEDGPMLEIVMVSSWKQFSSGAGSLEYYYCEDDWYLISPDRMVPMYAVIHDVEPGVEYTYRFRLSPQVLEHPGRYMYYWDGAGYCEFQVEEGASS